MEIATCGKSMSERYRVLIGLQEVSVKKSIADRGALTLRIPLLRWTVDSDLSMFIRVARY